MSFEHMYNVSKKEWGTVYGSIRIKNIIFDPIEIEKILPLIVFDEDNLKHMFAEDSLNDFKRKNIYKRFIPKIPSTEDLDSFIDDSISTNRSFYSFLAEGILGLVFRDLYGYDLAKGVIDATETLTDSHTGVDACMYNLDKNVIVLGEAKFYDSFDQGIRQIIVDFTIKNIKNKLESLQRKAENCKETNSIILKNLSTEEYEELTIEQFVNQKLIFAGFVLHSEDDISDYKSKDFYNKYYISTEKLSENICKCLAIDKTCGNYEIIFVHLPISNKKELISSIISKAKEYLNRMSRGV